MAVIEGSYDLRIYAGVPGNGTNEVQTLTIGGTPTSGTFKLRFDGFTTGPITWSATNVTLLANIQAALDALPSLGTNGCVASAGTLTAGIGTILLTFGQNLAKLAVATITVALNSLAGSSPTLAIVETTPGVSATERGAPRGALVIDITNGVLYINTGTALVPTWVEVGVVSNLEVVTAMLATKAVTGVKLDEAALNGLVFTGHNGAGACTLTGAKVGDKVVALANITDASEGKAAFESTITVVDQIQQSSATDLSAKKFTVLLVVKS